jgi:hypothetical protein
LPVCPDREWSPPPQHFARRYFFDPHIAVVVNSISGAHIGRTTDSSDRQSQDKLASNWFFWDVGADEEYCTPELGKSDVLV